MRPEKQFLTKEYLGRLNASPFFIVVNYKGLSVGHMTELRKRLSKAGAEVHIVKNSIFRIAAKEAGVGDLNGALAGHEKNFRPVEADGDGNNKQQRKSSVRT